MPLPVQICTWNLEFILRPRWKVSLNFALPFHVIYNTFFVGLNFTFYFRFVPLPVFFTAGQKKN